MEVNLFKLSAATPKDAAAFGYAEAAGAIGVNFVWHRGIDATTRLDVVAQAGVKYQRLISAAVSGGVSVRGAGQFQAGFPLDLFTEQGGGLVALLRLQLEAAGFVRADVGLNPDFLTSELAKSFPGPFTELLEIFAQELYVEAGVWAHAGVTAQLVGQVELTGRLFPTGDAGFTFFVQFAAGWYFGWGLNYVTNFRFADSQRLLSRLSAKSSQLLLAEAQRYVDGLPPGTSAPAQQALPYLRVLMPIATRALFELAAVLVDADKADAKDVAASSIAQSAFATAQRAALHAVFDVAMARLRAMVQDQDVLEYFLRLDPAERDAAIEALKALLPKLNALDALPLEEPAKWVPTVIDCLAPLESLAEMVLPARAGQTVATIWSAARLLELVLPWLTDAHAGPPQLDSVEPVDTVGADASSDVVGASSGIQPGDPLPYQALVAFLVQHVDLDRELRARSPELADALEWLAHLAGCDPDRMFAEILQGAASLTTAQISERVDALTAATLTALDDQVLPHLLDPLIAEAAQSDPEMREFLEDVVRPVLVSLPKVILPLVADLGSDRSGPRLSEAASAILLQTTTRFVLKTLDTLAPQWLADGADSIEKVAAEVEKVGTSHPAYSAVAGLGGALLLGIDVLPGDVKDLLDVCAYAMRKWNEEQCGPLLEATRQGVDLVLRSGGTKVLTEIATTDNPPSAEALGVALGRVADGLVLLAFDGRMLEYAATAPLLHAKHQGEQIGALAGVAAAAAVKLVGRALEEFDKVDDFLTQLAKDIPDLAAKAAQAVADLVGDVQGLAKHIEDQAQAFGQNLVRAGTALWPPELRDLAVQAYADGFEATRQQLNEPLAVLDDIANWVAASLESQLRSSAGNADTVRAHIRNAVYQRPNPIIRIPVRLSSVTALPIPPPFNVLLTEVVIPGPDFLGMVANAILGSHTVNARIDLAAEVTAEQNAKESQRKSLQNAQQAKMTDAQAKAARKLLTDPPPHVAVSITTPADQASLHGPTLVTVRADGASEEYIGNGLLSLPSRVRILVNDRQLAFDPRGWKRDGTAMTYTFQVIPPTSDDPPIVRPGWAEQASLSHDPVANPWWWLRLVQAIGRAGTNTVTVSCVDADPRTVGIAFTLEQPRRSDLLCYDKGDASAAPPRKPSGLWITCQSPGSKEFTNADADDTWTAIVAGVFRPTDVSDIAFYSASSGRLRTTTLQLTAGQATATIAPLWEGNIGAGWDHLVSGRFTPTPAGPPASLLLLYRTGTGEAALWSSDGRGGQRDMVAHDELGPGWTTLVAGRLTGDLASFIASGSQDSLLLYKSNDGTLELRSPDDTGQFPGPLAAHNIGTGWTDIVPGDFGGPTRRDLYCADAATGSVQLWGFGPNGDLQPLCDATPPAAGGPGLFAGGDFTHTGGTDEVFVFVGGQGAFASPTSADPRALTPGMKVWPPGFHFTQLLSGRFT